MLKLLTLVAAPAALLYFGTGAPVPPANTAAATVATLADTYQIDGGHSSVVFKVKHAGAAWFYGTFESLSGSFTVDEADPGKSMVEVEIESGSVDSNSDQRDGHIESPDFLSAKEFPKITFKSTSAKGSGDGNLELVGDLTFRGVTKPITAAVEFVGKGEFRGQRAGYEATFSFKRSDFGSTYGLEGDVLGDEVHLIVSLEGVKE